MANIENLNNLLQNFVENGLSGCALMIAQHGKTIYEGYFGHADIEANTPVNSKSIFRMASMSKIPMYTALMMLYERGKFLLTDPVYNFFPEWKETKRYVRTPNGHVRAVPVQRPITVGDTLAMKCGLPYCHSPVPPEEENPTLQAMARQMQPLWDKGCFTLRQQIAAMAEAPLAFEPGSHWLYGFSSELAAGIIEAVCDMPVNEALAQLLFRPLGMEDTGAIFFGDTQNRMVKLYKKETDGALRPLALPMDNKHLPGKENESGWARLFSTAADYTKLMQMLACGGEYKGQRIIGRKTIDLMRADGLNAAQLHDFDDPYNAGYSFGYGVRTLVDKNKGNHNGSLGAFGWTGGFGTWCEADPTEGVSIVYMHNMMPNMERFYHLTMRNAAYGCIE